VLGQEVRRLESMTKTSAVKPKPHFLTLTVKPYERPEK
jgi:hypothetical protein